MYWVTSTVILGGLGLGIGLAIGHHIYYMSLNDTVADDFLQTWAIRFGSVFAVLTRVSFSASLATSIVQLLWKTFQGTSKSTSLSALDSLFDITRNPLGFFRWQTWTFNPVLVIFGVITCYNSSSEYWAPHVELKRLALSTANSGAIRALNPVHANSSYTLDFYGPSLKCDPYALKVPPGKPATWRPTTSGKYTVKYYGSAPFNNGTANMTSLLPLLESLYDVLDTSDPTRTYGTSSSPTGESEYYTGLDMLSTDGAKFFVFYSPTSATGYGSLGERTIANETATANRAMQCTLYNSSYQVEWSFQSGAQTIAVKKEERLHTVSAISNYQTNATGPLEAYNFPTMNYQAVMHAVGQLVMGWLDGEWAGGDGVTGNSRITDTSLVYTRQFDDFRAGYEFVNATETASNRSLAYAMEDTLRNVILSLFAHSRFLKEKTDPVAVTVGSPQNIWHYSPYYLVLVYSISGLFTLLGAVCGITSLHSNGVAFENSPSTILRVTRNPQLDVRVKPEDTIGAQPVPDYLARTKVTFTGDHKKRAIILESTSLLKTNTPAKGDDYAESSKNDSAAYSRPF
ncbi:hypothetical protein SCUP515_03609 [Seiridium cupressi]